MVDCNRIGVILDLHFLQVALLQLGLKTTWQIDEFEQGLERILQGTITSRIAADAIVGSGNGADSTAEEGKFADRECKYGVQCTRKGCWFSHPPGYSFTHASPSNKNTRSNANKNRSKAQLHQRLQDAGYELRLSENKRQGQGKADHYQIQKQGAVDVEVALAVVTLAGGFTVQAPG
jgi:hypothetical protein